MVILNRSLQRAQWRLSLRNSPILESFLISQSGTKKVIHFDRFLLRLTLLNAAGRLVFELYAKDCPITCENFRCLCTGAECIAVLKMSFISFVWSGEKGNARSGG